MLTNGASYGISGGPRGLEVESASDTIDIENLSSEEYAGEVFAFQSVGIDSSKVDATMNLKIDMSELDRLAGIDFSKFDDKGVSEKYADKDLQHRYGDRMLLGENFMLDDSKITCTSTYQLTIN